MPAKATSCKGRVLEPMQDVREQTLRRFWVPGGKEELQSTRT